MMQTFEPVHSRISSVRPSAIFCGKKGSAIDGRAAPMRSNLPDRMVDAIRSGSVIRATPTIGFAVASRIPAGPRASTAIRVTTAQSSPTACFTPASVSSQKRARCSSNGRRDQKSTVPMYRSL